jgi:hypothetical protein
LLEPLPALQIEAAHLESFKTDGYVVIRNAYCADEVQMIQSWCDELLALPERAGEHWVYHEKSLDGAERNLVSRIENIHPFHAGFRELIVSLSAPVAMLLGEPVTLFKEKVNFKMAGGDGFTPHQDSQAGWDRYADFFVSALVSVDAATVENGCLELCAGHHQRGLFKSWEPLKEADMADMTFVPVPTEPGDVVFFDCFAPHRSAPNHTDRMRRIYYATFNRSSAGDHMAKYYEDKHASYPPDIDRLPDRDYVFRV